ncbi:hypothetical protein A3H16_03670 [Candidatus Kaiserbacteria bacterium RIFCSPLOWO2_12_FULL_53_8]|uniref:Uncharacterized protein n=2 Tax=Candidatus Kaiseribacteriota TaxID=1752734 RepID=A0A1F6CTL0_9BACT|nr:MAG: hypothetical protein A2851_05410 [Candidatus Kaiserbacteria bacterium RIFCSPHIGHO2_01_FULL_53_29]OGG92144.1 MAG: hypothetical protein A3H16_03670 [Candidatus Kaiserbacteria bacterium RIFCSPLOWO2_12_FULL_53_8]
MREDKRAAFKLRKSGKSYRKIMAELQIPRATLSDWFSKVNWSRKLKAELARTAQVESTHHMIALDAIRGKRLARAYAQARREARVEFGALKYNPLFIAGVMLYWGEGDKRTRGQVRLANTDPELIRLFVFFLKNACRVPSERIGASVLIYPDLDPEGCREYWSTRSNIKIQNFHKCVTIRGRHKTRKLSYGVCSIFVLSTYFKEKILEWLRLMPHELMSRKYYASIGHVAGVV